MRVICSSSRLWIREHEERDLDELHGLISDPLAMRFLPEIRTQTREQSRCNLRHALDESKSPNRRDFFFAVELKWGGYAGEVGITTMAGSAGERRGNLGYFFKPAHQGKGYATEAVIALLAYSFQVLCFEKIETGCLAENTGSQRVMVKAGFKKEGEYPCHTLHEGRPKDRLEFGLAKRDWLLSR